MHASFHFELSRQKIIKIINLIFDETIAQFRQRAPALLVESKLPEIEEVVISLIYAKCLPVLLYSTEACRILVRDKRSLEFTVTRSLMKLFRTSSANIVQNCRKCFRLLPVSNLIDYVLPNFMFVDYLLAMLNVVWIKKFSTYSDDIVSTCNLRSVVSDDIIIYVPYVHLVKLILFYFFFSVAADIVK